MSLKTQNRVRTEVPKSVPVTEKKAEKPIGALWFKTGKSGVEYFTGDLELNGDVIRIKVFKNSYKDADNHPDWKIYIREPLESHSNP
jgi:uncharacterized protein (DUF736 family)